MNGPAIAEVPEDARLARRDQLLARLLLCVHPVVPRESQYVALLTWGLAMDPAIAAKASRRTMPRVRWLLERFRRRVRVFRLIEAIPRGRYCAERLAALVELIHREMPSGARGREGAAAWEVETLNVLGAAAEFLVSHPLSGALLAHDLRERVVTRRRRTTDEPIVAWLRRAESETARLLSDALQLE